MKEGRCRPLTVIVVVIAIVFIALFIRMLYKQHKNEDSSWRYDDDDDEYYTSDNYPYTGRYESLGNDDYGYTGKYDSNDYSHRDSQDTNNNLTSTGNSLMSTDYEDYADEDSSWYN